MFSSPPSARRFVCRPQLESLEGRVVPSLIPDGWIIQTTSPSGFVHPSLWRTLASFPTGVVAVDPSTGEQSVVAARSGGLLSRPDAITIVNTKLYVADHRAPGGGGVIEVDPSNGDQSLIASPGDAHQVHAPTAIASIHDFLYVASTRNDAGTVLPNLVQINLSTLAESEIAYGGSFSEPVGLTPVPNDDHALYCADATAGNSGTGEILEVNLITGAQQCITQGNLLNFPAGLTQERDPDSGLPTGNLLVVNGGDGSVLRVSPDGSQTRLASLGPGSGLDSVVAGSGIYGPGTIFVAAMAKETNPGTIFAINPRTGEQTVLSSGGNFSAVAGLAFASDGNTLYVGTSPSPSSTPIDPSAKIGIIGVNPVTGQQTTIAVRPPGLFVLPLEICEGPAPQNYLYVADLTACDTGAIIRVDPSDGSQTLLATGAYLYVPNAITFVNGSLYVADVGDSSGYTHNIVRIDPNNSDINTNQTLITEGSGLVDFFTNPQSITPVLGDQESIYVADEPGNVDGNLPSQVWKVNLRTGEQSRFGPAFPTTGFAAHLDRIVMDPRTGNLYAETIGGDGTAGALVLVGPESLTLISVHDKFIGNNGIAVKPDGTGIYIPTIASDTRNARMLFIDITDPLGTQNIVTEGFNLSLVAGLRVFQESGGEGSPPPSPLAPAQRISQTPAVEAGLIRLERGIAPVPLTVLPAVPLTPWPSQPAPLSKEGDVIGSTLRRAGTRATPISARVLDSLFADRLLLAATWSEQDRFRAIPEGPA